MESRWPWLAVFPLAALSLASASAQPVPGLYIAGLAGANLQPVTTSGNGITEVKTAAGPVGLVALGWRFPQGIRLELEGGQRRNDVDAQMGWNTGGYYRALGNPSGRVTVTSTMLNAIYEADLRPYGIGVRPYLGGGLGAATVNYSNLQGETVFALPTIFGPLPFPGLRTLDGAYRKFALQAIAGVSVSIGAVPGLEAMIEYRFLDVHNAKVRATDSIPLLDLTGPTVTQRLPNTNQSVLIGLRYAFGWPRPVPAVPAPN